MYIYIYMYFKVSFHRNECINGICHSTKDLLN